MPFARTTLRSLESQRELAAIRSGRLRWLAARAAAVIRIDAMWLAFAPVDMRAGADRLLAAVVHVFGEAQAHQWCSYFS